MKRPGAAFGKRAKAEQMDMASTSPQGKGHLYLSQRWLKVHPGQDLRDQQGTSVGLVKRTHKPSLPGLARGRRRKEEEEEKQGKVLITCQRNGWHLQTSSTPRHLLKEWIAC